MKRFQKAICVSILIFAFLYANQNVLAAEYVLPYPSFMPGNKLYKVTRILDGLERWWFWGSIASFKYHLKLADKYLIEAKTLFEYKQYQLGVDALKRSDAQMPQITESLRSAQREGKDIHILKDTMVEAMKVHILVIEKFSSELPETYIWKPEKSPSTVLELARISSESLEDRKKLLE